MGSKGDMKRSGGHYEPIIDEPSEKKSRIDAQYESNLIGVGEDQGIIPVGNGTGNGNECFINQLPVEILEIILGDSGFSKDTKKNLRLVCKLWQIVCNQRINERRIIWRRLNTGNDPNAYERIADFQFEKFNLYFAYNEVKRLPLTIWEKIGVKIVSLDFYYCRIGDKLMETIIRVCENLRFFRVLLSVYNRNEMFCTPKTLKNLNTTRRSLKTFEISIRGYPKEYRQLETWQPIFEAFLRIYPNIIHYCVSYHKKKLSFTLSEQHREADICKMSSILALLLSEPPNWKIAIEKLSTVRLKELQCIEIDFGEQEKQVEKELVLLILDNCPELLHLKYGTATWSQTLNLVELSKLTASSVKVDELLIGSFTFLPKRSLISIRNDPSLGLGSLVPHFIFVQHLDIVEVNISDEALQIIFKYLTDLRTLKLLLNFKNTHFGLIGRNDEGIENSSYSINRLQNLEKLTLRQHIIQGYMYQQNWSISDAIFSGFHLPKLHYLHTFSPSEIFDFGLLGSNLPQLKTINLLKAIHCFYMFQVQSRQISELSLKSISSLCKHSRNLHTVEMKGVRYNVTFKTAKCIFTSCPTLRYLNTQKHSYYYDSVTKNVKYKIRY